MAGLVVFAGLAMVVLVFRAGRHDDVSLLDISSCTPTTQPGNIDGGVVSTARDVREDLPELNVMEDLRLGESDSVADLPAIVRHVELTSQGSVLLYNASTKRLRMFDTEGREQWSIDGAGFGYVSQMGVVADTIVLLTRQGRRQSIRMYGVDGLPMRTPPGLVVDLDRLLEAGCSATRIVGLQASGLMLFTGSAESIASRSSGRVHRIYELRTFSPGGGVGRVVWSWTDPVPDHLVDIMYSPAAERGEPIRTLHAVRPPWSPTAKFAFFDDGFYFSPAGTAEVQKYDAQGRRTGAVVFTGNPISVGTVDLDGYYAPIYQSAQPSGYRQALRDSILAVGQRMRPARTLPALSALWASRDGTLAAIRSAVEEIRGVRHVAVDVMNADGTVRGRFWLADSVQIMAFGGAYLYGHERRGDRGSAGAVESVASRPTTGGAALIRYLIGN